jgi:hypothetical protein
LKTLLQIVPKTPGSFDGVGDYALNLARAISAEHDLQTTFLVAATTAVTSKDGFDVLSGLNVQASAELAQRHTHVILHYVNYGYQARGVPRSLRAFVEAMRPLLRGRWVTTFHELYASGPPWKSAFWLRPFQVRIAHAMIDASTSCVVSNAAIDEAIHAYDSQKKVYSVPVMSNFGEPELADLALASPKRWAICGGTALIARSLRLFEELRPLIPPEFAPQHLDVVGGREDAAIIASVERLKRDISVHQYGEVSVELASEVLRQASFGWLDYFADGKVSPGMILKSTAFAALCAHGVIPILAHREGPISIEGDALPGPFYLTSNGAHFPAPDEVPELRRRHHQWYGAHAHSREAARIYGEALS